MMNNMIKRLLLLGLAVMVVFTAIAQEKIKALRFNHVDGSVYVSLQKELTCDFATEDEIAISADGKAFVRLKLSDMSGFTTVEVSADKATGIVNLPSGKDVLVESTNEGLAVEGLAAVERVKIYNAGGTLIATLKADENGMAKVSISLLPKGIYILKIGNRKTLKIQRL